MGTEKGVLLTGSRVFEGTLLYLFNSEEDDDSAVDDAIAVRGTFARDVVFV